MTTDPIIEKIEASRQELLDLSLRNRLLNYHPLRAKGLAEIEADPVSLFDVLVREKRAISFLPQPDEDDSDPPQATPTRLQTPEKAEDLQARLLKTYYAANTITQEQGVNTLFIALGMVEWYEAMASDTERRAPLVLIPVSLERTSVRVKFSVAYTGEELGENVSFKEKLRNDFGVDLPDLRQAADADDEDLDVADYFSRVAQSIHGMESWSVDTASVELGFFSFHKLLMYRDLDSKSWPAGNGPSESRIMRALFGDGFAEPEPTISDEDHLDDHLRPKDTHHVVDADSSQALAILDVKNGRNLVIQGPPGTGKSQTITNVIAEAIARGKKALFVSEKMAALEVVKRRLDELELGAACLELHSRKTNKKSVLDELRKTLYADKPGIVKEGDFTALIRERKRLNAYAEAVNTPVGETGVSPFEAYGQLMRIRDSLGSNGCGSPPRLEIACIDSWSNSDFGEKRNIVSDLQAILKSVGSPKDLLFWGCQRRRMLPYEREELRDKINAALRTGEALSAATRALSGAMCLSDTPTDEAGAGNLLRAAECVADTPDIKGINLGAAAWRTQRTAIEKLRHTGLRWARLRAKYDSVLTPATWGKDVAEIRRALVGFRLRREVMSSCDPAIQSLEALLDAAHALGDALRLNALGNAAAAKRLVATAQHVVEAPDLKGINLGAAEWIEHRDEIERLRDLGVRWAELRAKHDSVLTPAAWDEDVLAVRRTLATTGRKKMRRWFSMEYHRSRKRLAMLCRGDLPGDVEAQIILADAIIEEQELRKRLAGLESVAAAALGSRWQGIDTAWEAIPDVINWTLKLHEDLAKEAVDSDIIRALDRGLDIEAILALLRQSEDALELYEADTGGFSAAEVDALHDHCRARNLLSLLCQGGLPKSSEQQVALVDVIMEERQLQETLARLSPVAEAALGSQWQEEETAWDAVSGVIEWAVKLHDDIDRGATDSSIIRALNAGIDIDAIPAMLQQARDSLNAYRASADGVLNHLEMDREKRFGHPDGFMRMSFSDQKQLLMEWSSRIDAVQDVVNVNRALQDAEGAGIHAIADLATERPEAAARLTDWFAYARYEQIVFRAFEERPALDTFAGAAHEHRIKRFRNLDRSALEHNRDRIAGAHRTNLLGLQAWTPPSGNLNREFSTLKREFEKKQRHLPIRQLMKRAGNAVQAIKPVFMMSPLSIATYLEPGSARFDLVIFDEASQVRPADALGALCRAEQAVVVGDEQQLPPTRFFDPAMFADDDDEDDSSVIADIESILGLMVSKNCPSRMLRWHYRSRHESLIAASNQEFYDNRLVVFPSPDSEKRMCGLHYHHLPDTVYDRGKSRTNRKEAKVVAQAVMEHARQHPSLTLGVAAFNGSQTQAIRDELEMLRQQDPDCEPFFSGKCHPEEPFFVKNLENVQGDERDVIFISVGYGRDATGQVSMNFGPLNQDGGERRLNVIITRAKRRCHVFTNLSADDIDLGKTQAVGVRVLKIFLAYAASGVLPADMPMPMGLTVDSPFQAAVASRLRARGYTAHEEVASGGKFIDIGIVDPERPGRYILGIECDGATYHSSRSARDRDRIREAHLRDLGWKLHRIWSTDWFQNEERELARAIDAIEAAKAAAT